MFIFFAFFFTTLAFLTFACGMLTGAFFSREIGLPLGAFGSICAITGVYLGFVTGLTFMVVIAAIILVSCLFLTTAPRN